MTIGATRDSIPTVGDNVFIEASAEIIGEIRIEKMLKNRDRYHCGK